MAKNHYFHLFSSFSTIIFVIPVRQPSSNQFTKAFKSEAYRTKKTAASAAVFLLFDPAHTVSDHKAGLEQYLL